MTQQEMAMAQLQDQANVAQQQALSTFWVAKSLAQAQGYMPIGLQNSQWSGLNPELANLSHPQMNFLDVRFIRTPE